MVDRGEHMRGLVHQTLDVRHEVDEHATLCVPKTRPDP
jgi:hypothetical protein